MRAPVAVLVAVILSGVAQDPQDRRQGSLAEARQLLARARETANVRQKRRLMRRAEKAFRKSLASREKSLPTTHVGVLSVRQELARLLEERGELARARELYEESLRATESDLAPADLRLQLARMDLASCLYVQGDYRRALELVRKAVDVYAAKLPADDPRLIDARENLACILTSLDDYAKARPLFEEVLRQRRSVARPDDLAICLLEQNYAVALRRLGDVERAHRLETRVLARVEKELAPDDPRRMLAQANLGATKRDVGDLVGARRLLEDVLGKLTEKYPAGHPDVLSARQNLAATYSEMGRLSEARRLEESLLEAWLARGPATSPQVQVARRNLAATLTALGKMALAAKLQRETLRALLESLPPHHPLVLIERQNLALTRFRMGETEKAHAELVSVLSAMEDRRNAPRALTEVCTTLAWASVAARKRDDLPDLLGRLIDSMTREVFVAAALPDLQSRHSLWHDRYVSNCLSLTALVADAAHRPALDRRSFVFVESLRGLAALSPTGSHRLPDDAELSRLSGVALRARRRLADLVAGLRVGAAGHADTKEVDAAAAARDSADSALLEEMRSRGLGLAKIQFDRLVSSLPEKSAVVAYRRYARAGLDRQSRSKVVQTQALLAHVLRKDGSLERIELGGMDAIVRHVEGWRAAIGQPLSTSGTKVASMGSDDVAKHGKALRGLVLDPILTRVGDARTLRVCLDDVLHLVPLDALPLGGGCVGDRFSIRCVVSLARQPRRPIEAARTASLLVVGDVDFDGKTKRETGSTRGGEFGRLPGSKQEVESVGALFESAFERKANVLVGSAATKRAFHDLAPNARFLHLATHGYFAPESLASTRDLEPSGVFGTFADAVRGVSPLAICGIALAGANRGPDELGRVPGILTAEELAGIDLRNCELAVLSACETNVGLRRAGQGIQSLSTALHTAGVRRTLTSLWRIADTTTRMFMERFYEAVWKRKQNAHEALWDAKRHLRRRRIPTRHWAGFVLVSRP